MGEADFGPIDGTIASRFENSKKRRKIRIEYNPVDNFLASKFSIMREPIYCVSTFIESIAK